MLYFDIDHNMFSKRSQTNFKTRIFFFLEFILIISTFWTFQTQFIFPCLYNVCVITSVRISHWSGIKQIGEAANILFSLSFLKKKKKKLLQLEVKCEHVTSLNFYVYARPSIHCLYFVTSVKFTFVHLGLISSVA